MKIAHIIFDLGNGGAENMLIDIINEQVKLDNFITLVIINNYVEKDKLNRLSNAVNIIKLNRIPKSKNPFIFIKLYWYIFKDRFDVLHCHNPGIGKLLRFYKKRKVVTVHCIGWNEKWLKYYTKIFSISKAVQNDIKNLGFNSTIIYNGVDSTNINFNSIYMKNKPFRIVQVGRLNHLIKGQDLMILALKKLIKTNEIHLTFVGDGESRDSLEQLVHNENIKKYILFEGNKNRDYIYNNLNKFDLLVQPSRQEGFGLTIVEAMFAKIPVLVSNIDGPFEIIKSGKYGGVFNNDDVDSLVNSIQKIINYSNSEINNKVNASYTFAVENFNIKNVAKSYIENY